MPVAAKKILYFSVVVIFYQKDKDVFLVLMSGVNLIMKRKLMMQILVMDFSSYN